MQASFIIILPRHWHSLLTARRCQTHREESKWDGADEGVVVDGAIGGAFDPRAMIKRK
jgi:hypothetical protein